MNDYVDENYLEYTTNYKAQLITPEDYNFIMSIQRREQNYEYIPNNAEEIIKRLDDEDFKYSAVLNKKIIFSIEVIKSTSESEKSKKYENLMGILKDTKSKPVYEAIKTFLETTDDESCDILLRHIIPIRPTLFSELLTNEALTLEKRNLLVSCIIKYTRSYKVQDTDKKLTHFLNKCEKYMDLFLMANDDEKVVKFLQEISPCFDKLSDLNQKSKIQQCILLNCMYSINLENLEIVFEINNADGEFKDFYTRNYDYISNADKKVALDYVNKNLEIYTKRILLDKRVNCTEEPQENIEFILKADDIDDIETKKSIIMKSKIKIEDISEFDEKLFGTLLATNSIIPTWANLFYVVEFNGFDSVIEYLKHEKNITGNFEISEGCGDTPIKLIREILQKLIPREIKDIAKTIFIDVSLDDLQIHDINDENLAVFIEAVKVSYNDDDLITLYEKHNSLCAYLKKHSVSVMENFDVFFKSIISASIQTGGSSIDKNNSNFIISTIINYIGIDNKMKRLLIEKCEKIININKFEKSYADFFISEKMEIPSAILWQFTNSAIIGRIDKINMLNQSINIVSTETELKNLKKYIRTLDKETGAIIEVDKITLEQTTQNEMLLKILKDKGILTYSKARARNEFIVEITD